MTEKVDQLRKIEICADLVKKKRRIVHKLIKFQNDPLFVQSLFIIRCNLGAEGRL